MDKKDVLNISPEQARIVVDQIGKALASLIEGLNKVMVELSKIDWSKYLTQEKGSLFALTEVNEMWSVFDKLKDESFSSDQQCPSCLILREKIEKAFNCDRP